MRKRPDSAIVRYRGIAHELDLAACRRALFRLEVEGVLYGIDGVAEAARVSRSTVSRFFSGRQTSLQVTLAILAVLRLDFDDVAKPSDPDPPGRQPPNGRGWLPGGAIIGGASRRDGRPP